MPQYNENVPHYSENVPHYSGNVPQNENNEKKYEDFISNNIHNQIISVSKKIKENPDFSKKCDILQNAHSWKCSTDDMRKGTNCRLR